MATAGVLRVANNVTILSARNAADNANITVVATNSSNERLFGSTSDGGNTYLQSPTSTSVVIKTDTLEFQNLSATQLATLTASGLTLSAGIPLRTTVAAMGALNVDWAEANIFTKSLASGGNTITFSNEVDGQSITVVLSSHSGGSTVTWPAAVKWTGGTEPTMSTPSKTDVYTFIRAGTVVYGSYVQDLS
jgi:hypothetical protein